MAADGACGIESWVLFEILLLYAGHPLQPVAPPVPLHWPPPGQVPVGAWLAAIYVDLPACAGPSAMDGERLLWSSPPSKSEPGADTDADGGRLKLVGLDVFRAL